MRIKEVWDRVQTCPGALKKLKSNTVEEIAASISSALSSKIPELQVSSAKGQRIDLTKRYVSDYQRVLTSSANSQLPVPIASLFDFLQKTLAYDCNKRVPAILLLQHEWLQPLTTHPILSPKILNKPQTPKLSERILKIPPKPPETPSSKPTSAENHTLDHTSTQQEGSSDDPGDSKGNTSIPSLSAIGKQGLASTGVLQASTLWLPKLNEESSTWEYIQTSDPGNGV